MLGELSPNTPVTWIKHEPAQIAQPVALGYYSDDLQDGQVEFSLPEPSPGASSVGGRASLQFPGLPLWIWAPWLPEELKVHTSAFRESLLGLLPPELSDFGDPETLNKVVVECQDELKRAYVEALEALSLKAPIRRS